MVDDGSITLADLLEAATDLRNVTLRADELWQQHVHDADRWLSGSPAASDAALPLYGRHVRNLFAHVDLLVSAAFDHSSELYKWGEGASKGEPTPIWAPWSVARSLIEVCAVSAWLTESALPSRRRVSRMLVLDRIEALNRVGFGRDQTLLLRKIESDALALHIPTALDRRGRWRGDEDAMPTRSAQVKSLLAIDQFRAYSMLSAASHGEIWAIVNLGYVRAGDPAPETGLVMTRKEPPAIGLWTALRLTTIAVSEATKSATAYRGWA